MSGIRIEGLSKSYGAHNVLDELDLKVGAGECLTLLGPSCCGKMVLMRLPIPTYTCQQTGVASAWCFRTM